MFQEVSDDGADVVASTSRNDDFLKMATTDETIISADDLTKLTSYVLSHTTQLELIAAEFIEVFNMRCQLSIGTNLLHIREILSAMDTAETSEFLICRIICIYLVYRVRDIEPWLKRGKDENTTISGHIFLEFFLNLVDESKNGVTENILTSRIVEKRLAQLLLGGCPSEIHRMTARALYSYLSDASFDAVYRNSCSEIIREFNLKCESWPTGLDSKCGVYPHIFGSSKLLINEKSPKDVLQSFVQLQKDIIGVGRLFLGRRMTCIPVGMEIWSQPTFADERKSEDLRDSRLHNIITSNSPIPTTANMVEQAALVQDSATTESEIIRTADLHSFISTIIPNIKKGEPLPSGHLTLAYECIKQMEDSHPFFTEIADFPPLAINTYIEQHTKFSSELIYRIVKNDNDKIYLFLVVMMEMGFSVQCVEIVLRLYRCIPNLPTDILLEYCNSLMNICDTTTSSSQKARYVRIFSSFVITILNDGLLQEHIISNTKSFFHQIQAFALRNNEYKEATSLYQKIQEVLRKGSTSH